MLGCNDDDDNYDDDDDDDDDDGDYLKYCKYSMMVLYGFIAAIEW